MKYRFGFGHKSCHGPGSCKQVVTIMMHVAFYLPWRMNLTDMRTLLICMQRILHCSALCHHHYRHTTVQYFLSAAISES